MYSLIAHVFCTCILRLIYTRTAYFVFVSYIYRTRGVVIIDGVERHRKVFFATTRGFRGCWWFAAVQHVITYYATSACRRSPIVGWIDVMTFGGGNKYRNNIIYNCIVLMLLYPYTTTYHDKYTKVQVYGALTPPLGDSTKITPSANYYYYYWKSDCRHYTYHYNIIVIFFLSSYTTPVHRSSSRRLM